MGVVNVSSAFITDLQAIPQVRDTAGKGPSGVKVVQEVTIKPTTGDSANSTYALFRIPSGSKVKRLLVSSPSQGTTGIYEVGAFYANDGSAPLSNYKNTVHLYNGTDLIAIDFFIPAASAGADVGGQAGIVDAIPGGGWTYGGDSPGFAVLAATNWTAALGVNAELWSALAIGVGTVPTGGVDPKCNIDIVLTLTEAIGTAAALVAQIEYVI